MQTEQDKVGSIVLNRPGVITDQDFIFSTWLNGLYFGNDLFRQMNEHTFKKSYQKVLEALIPKTIVNISALKDDPDVILGYAVYSPKDDKNVLHWVFVKSAWRKIGIAKSLLPDNIIAVTHLTKVGQAVKPREWAFDPFLI